MIFHSMDSLQTHQTLLQLAMDRGCFRIRRTVQRMLSPKRLIPTAIVIVYAMLYLFYGLAILMSRPPASPERIQLWLSGGMVLYAIYHAVKSAWSSDDRPLSQAPAETLWLGGAPIRRSSIVVHQITDLAMASLLKTVLLCTVLAVDVQSTLRLGLGVFAALLLLEITRLIIARFVSSLNPHKRSLVRWAVTLLAAAIVAQIIARVAAAVPTGSSTPTYIVETFRAVGKTASSGAVQWLAMPWSFASNVAVSSAWDAPAMVQWMIAIAVLPVAIKTYLSVDRYGTACQHRDETDALQRYRTLQSDAGPLHSPATPDSENLQRSLHVPWYHPAAWPRPLGWIDGDAASIAMRTTNSVIRYRGTIFFSLLLPTLLCLSPIVTGQVFDPWFFVVGGIAMCTSLIAPAALKIDFRRDLRRIVLLRSLPVSPRSMVIGQLWFPVLLTCLFQWAVIAPAAMFLKPGLLPVCLWTGMLAALAAFTFATENALFLAYPHRQNNQGIGMVMRTNLTFLGKSSLLIVAVLVLAVWATFCRQYLSGWMGDLAMFAGAQVACWGLTFAAVTAATWCWKRFDISSELLSD
jgi:hypothetical protein